MKIFVTGGTGFVGQEILRRLRAAGHDIRLLARNSRASRVQKTASEFSAETFPGDVTDAATLGEGLRGCEAVIHLVGIISEVGRNTFENVHTRGTQNMVAAARQAGV